MTKHIIFATLLAIPFSAEKGGHLLFAQRTPNASMMMKGGAANAVPLSFKASADIDQSTIPASPILWGMDTAWDSEDNVIRGTNYIGTDVMATGRVSFQPRDRKSTRLNSSHQD